MTPAHASARAATLALEELAADLVKTASAPEDLALVRASVAFVRAERAKTVARDEGGADPSAVDAASALQTPYLDALCAQVPLTWTGHRARALAYLAWDDGDLAGRATGVGFFEDRLLWAIVRDMAAPR